MRQPLAVLVGAVVAGLGALILGEYEPAGFTPYVAGVLFGLAVGETIVAVARTTTVPLQAAAATLAAAGLAWAAWIAAARHWEWVPGAAWASVAIGAVAAALWVRTSGRSRSTSGTRPAPGPDPGT